jgi:hypothetical protein
MTPRSAALLAILASGCVETPPDPEPDWLFQGEWIDVEGRGRTADETCKGTFDYLDRYAEAVSVEFGANEHLGVYRWYSQERYEEEKPCNGRLPGACAGLNGTFSAGIPVDHELVHMANFLALPTLRCPSVISEGLAVYYSTGGETPSTGDFELLAQRFESPDEDIPTPEYDIAGRFVGMLVRDFGIDAVLELCTTTGSKPDAETLETAMISVFGSSPAQLLEELVNDTTCPIWRDYQSRVFACGEAGAARSAGSVDEYLIRSYELGCDAETTVGPRGGSIWIIEQIEFLHSGPHLVSMWNADNKVPLVELVVAPCVPCEQNWKFMPGDAVGPMQIEAGTYWLEMRADEDFSGEFTLEFTWLG